MYPAGYRNFDKVSSLSQQGCYDVCHPYLIIWYGRGSVILLAVVSSKPKTEVIYCGKLSGGGDAPASSFQHGSIDYRHAPGSAEFTRSA